MAAANPYLRPSTLSEALTALAEAPRVIAAGCTDLFPATEHKELPGPILDITAIEELRAITEHPDHFRLGATATWRDVIEADLPPAFDGLKRAAREVGAQQIQNRGTLAGNLCNASPAADGVPPLLTLDALVEVQNASGTQQIALSDFLTGARQTALAPGDIVTGILVPKHATTGHSHFMKLGARKYLVISIVMTAARLQLTDGVVTSAALAIGSCGPVATRLTNVEAALLGNSPDPGLITDADVAAAIAPIDDMRADAAYRTASAAELLRRTLANLRNQMEAA